MARQSLYRAYRPMSFEDVAGQEQVTRPLSEQVKNGTVGHAYLFAGSRGLGKTSVARIFARALGSTEKDIYEIDAASNNTVEDIRQLTENVYTLPFDSKYKVYILDEAHMLSKSAWNAFLKTLEEPPAHALFILATTELEKVPETVQSRCQVFTFKKPNREGLAAHVTNVAKKEKMTIEPAAADLIALLAEGSYRDALSILEKVSSVSVDKKLTLAETEEATGAPRRALVESFVRALSDGDTAAALEVIASLAHEHIEYPLYLSLVLEYVRTILLIRHAPELRKELEQDLGTDAFASVYELASVTETKLTHRTLAALLEAASRMRFSPIPSLALELAVYELAEA
ncbi:MAG TPA: DNA polymerase III subunit gamma/tau [Candidatus Paceibacterota bacterium]|nr:DNA polymerase III subunit gamma/tau [Candidatus Paceibacterota bacterium]